MDRDEVKIHKHAQQERGQYPAILTEQAWSIKDLLYGIKHQKMIFDLAGPSEKSRAILPSPVANQSAGFGSSCPLTELVIIIIRYIKKIQFDKEEPDSMSS